MILGTDGSGLGTRTTSSERVAFNLGSTPTHSGSLKTLMSEVSVWLTWRVGLHCQDFTKSLPSSLLPLPLPTHLLLTPMIPARHSEIGHHRPGLRFYMPTNCSGESCHLGKCWWHVGPQLWNGRQRPCRLEGCDGILVTDCPLEVAPQTAAIIII